MSSTPQPGEIREPRPPQDRPYGETFDPEKDCTKQSFAEECNINNILDRFIRTGVIDHVSKFGAVYGDFGTGAEFQEHMMQIANAQNMFNELPARARQYFNEDPAQFLDYVNGDEVTVEKLHELGIASPDYRAPVRDEQPGAVTAPEDGATDTSQTGDAA